jgi:hypothetical protein
MAVNIKSLLRVCGNTGLPGLQAKLYLIGKDEANAMPTVGSGAYGNTKTFTTAWDLVTTTGLGFWREIDILVDSAELQTLIEGNVGSLYIRNKLKFFVEKMGKEQLKFMDDMVADSGCLLGMIRAKGGPTFVLGDKDNPIFLEPSEGGATNDQIGMTYNLMCNTGLAPMIYNDGLAIDTTPAV